VVKIAKSIDGLYLQSVKRNNSGYLIEGLLDPLADISTLQNNNIQLKTKPFISLDSEILSKRINNIVSQYNLINFNLSDRTLHLTGSINKNNKQKLLEQLESINGIEQINTQLLSIKPEISPKKPKISSINTELLKQINKTIIYLPNEGVQGTELLRLNNVIKSLHSIIDSGIKIRLTLTGASDCNGIKSDQYSQKRANKIKSLLVNNGINKDIIKTDIKACHNYFNETNVSLLYVHFNIEQL
jgi:hypothetical protein